MDEEKISQYSLTYTEGVAAEAAVVVAWKREEEIKNHHMRRINLGGVIGW